MACLAVGLCKNAQLANKEWPFAHSVAGTREKYLVNCFLQAALAVTSANSFQECFWCPASYFQMTFVNLGKEERQALNDGDQLLVEGRM